MIKAYKRALQTHNSVNSKQLSVKLCLKKKLKMKRFIALVASVVLLQLTFGLPVAENTPENSKQNYLIKKKKISKNFKF